MRTRAIRIFIVEDSFPLLKALTAMIGAIPGTEIVGSSARAVEAAEEIARLKPDVAILDFRLACGTGHDVLRAIRSAGLPGPLAIVFSNQKSERFRKACLALGASYVFSKTGDFRALEDLLSSLAGQQE